MNKAVDLVRAIWPLDTPNNLSIDDILSVQVTFFFTNSKLLLIVKFVLLFGRNEFIKDYYAVTIFVIYM